MTEVTINCLFGGWGRAKGTAWFDDIELAPAPGSELAGEVGRVVRLVTVHYAQRGPVESIVPTLAALQGASPEVAVAILEGLTSGWPADKSPTFSADEKQTLASLMQSLPDSARDRLLSLAQRWGQPELFGTSVAAIIESLRKQVTNTATAMMARWLELTPIVRRAAIAVLMRRAEWALSLLDAVANGKIKKGDLAQEHWSQLKQNPNRAVARRAERLAEIKTGISADREEIVKKLLPLAKEQGDAARGKEVFAATCAVCHTFNGQDGKVGPDLTGIAARDRTEIFTDILDPNRSVEANYRLWNVTTKGGDTFSGRLEAETQTTVEILDTTAQKHVVQRKEIASLDASQLSIMPAGFEALPADDLKGLLEYLCQMHQ